MKYFAIILAALTMAACSSTPPAPPLAQGQPQVIVIHHHAPAPVYSTLPTTPPAQYWIPVPAAKVYQNPAYIRGY